MKKLVIKYSKLSTELKKAVRQKLENEDVKFLNFPYQGNIEEGFLFETEGDEVNYLVILDIEKKPKYKPTEEEDEDDEDDDDFDDVAVIEEDIKGVDADADEFKVDDDVDDVDDVDDFDDEDDEDDVDDVAEEEFDDDDEK